MHAGLHPSIHLESDRNRFGNPLDSNKIRKALVGPAHARNLIGSISEPNLRHLTTSAFRNDNLPIGRNLPAFRMMNSSARSRARVLNFYFNAKFNGSSGTQTAIGSGGFLYLIPDTAPREEQSNCQASHENQKAAQSQDSHYLDSLLATI